MISLLDPLAIIDWPYQALDSENAACRKLLQISDHKQSVAPAPYRSIPHTTNSAGGR